MIQDYFFSGVKTILMKEEPFSANLQECKEMFQNITLHNSFTLLGILFRCRIFLKFFSAALLEIINKLWNPLSRVSSIKPTRYSLAHVKKRGGMGFAHCLVPCGSESLSQDNTCMGRGFFNF